jgi:hypothetical protein
MTSEAKTLDDLNTDLSQLYDGLKSGQIELPVAQELANIGGKLFKVQALMWAKEVFAADPRTGGRLVREEQPALPEKPAK